MSPRTAHALRLYAVLALLALAIALPSLLGCACGSVPNRFVAALSGMPAWASASCTGPPVVPSTSPAQPSPT